MTGAGCTGPIHATLGSETAGEELHRLGRDQVHRSNDSF